MKKLLFIASVLLLFTACSDDTEWDFVTPSLLITATDSEGNDLFDQEDDKTTITYKGELYRIGDVEGTSPRANVAQWMGLQRSFNSSLGLYELSFGQFNPENDYSGEELTINWEDGTTNAIKFDLYVHWRRNNPTVTMRTYIDGERYSNSELRVHFVRQ